MSKIKLAIILFVHAIISSCSNLIYDPEINTAFDESVELFNECIEALNQQNGYTEYADELDEVVYKRIDSLQNSIETRIKYSLANPPHNRKDCFRDLTDLIGLVNQYAQYVTNPRHDIYFYMETKRLSEEIHSGINMMQIKYSDIITSRFSRTKIN